ncbi:class I SAM-dependent methyltransferase [Breznakiella homolactica]|uniref:Methyltransferase domain-containing protein n=1 Tax=Breznakiella homolactica TaxID=2798577 RepID=A0A7T7XJL7_9SPIR|nr:methyltransferase domain-containing protein [Breznakiella homolactica]QQO07629.1 methyltransferase domain-containing protein [Breznakiella homolactica]
MDNKELVNSFDKKAAAYDDETNTFSHKIIEYINQENLKLELPKPDKSIKLLDLGGGTGKYSLFFSKLGYTVSLADISKESLLIAGERFSRENEQITMVNSSGENLPFGDKSFGIILMLGGVISYASNPEDLLKECRRVLKDKGILYLDFLNTIGWGNEVLNIKKRLEIIEQKEAFIKMPDWDYPAHLFNYKYMEEMIQTSGFRIKSKYALINATTSLPLSVRYGKEYDAETLDRYKKIELELSRDKECYGTSWSCCIGAVK